MVAQQGNTLWKHDRDLMQASGKKQTNKKQRAMGKPSDGDEERAVT